MNQQGYPQQQQGYNPQLSWPPHSAQTPYPPQPGPGPSARPPSFPQSIQAGGMQIQGNYTPQQQQQIAAMMASRQYQNPHQQPPPPLSQHQQQGMMGPPQMVPGPGGSHIQGMTREHQQQALAMMQAQQAAIAQQRQHQEAQSGGGSGSAGPSHKKKKPKLPAQQMLPRQPPPPRTNEAYRQAAMSAPVIAPAEPEPWADALDEVDPRELAMGRFRARQETLAEIFGPEPITTALQGYRIALIDTGRCRADHTSEDILAVQYDPWSALGMGAESLEEKVTSMEEENEVLSSRMDSDITTFRQRLADAEGVEVSTVMIPA